MAALCPCCIMLFCSAPVQIHISDCYSADVSMPVRTDALSSHARARRRAAMQAVQRQVITALWWNIIIHSSAHKHHLSCWAPPYTQSAPHQGQLHPPAHTHARHPSHKAPAYKGTPRITPALSLYILHHCLLFLPYAAFSPLFCCSLTIWVRDHCCRLPCITLIYQEAKSYFMLPPHLLPCISPGELMNAGSDACPPMLVDYKKEKEEENSGMIIRLGFKGGWRKYCRNGSRHRQRCQLRCVFRAKACVCVCGWGRGQTNTPG